MHHDMLGYTNFIQMKIITFVSKLNIFHHCRVIYTYLPCALQISCICSVYMVLSWRTVLCSRHLIELQNETGPGEEQVLCMCISPTNTNDT